MKKNIGVLAFQGDIIEHQHAIEEIGHRFIPVRSSKEVDQIDALIIPGGESTTIGFFLEETGVGETIQKLALAGLPVWGTCAGAIVMAKTIKSRIVPPHLSLIDMVIERNAYGRQVDSFYTGIDIPKLHISSLSAAFIRAPIIRKVGKKVEILAQYKNEIILVRQGNLLASTFHPELTGDIRLLECFTSTFA